MRPAAELLLTEGAALREVLERTPEPAFDRPTICTGWSVRDVLAHCGAALSAMASGELHRFTPEDNEQDVAERRPWPLRDVIDELLSGYEHGATAVDRAGGRFDAIALGEWVHGGDVREALGEPGPYSSEGADIALTLLFERSRTMRRPEIAVVVDGQPEVFGVPAPDRLPGSLTTDLETFVRLCGGRRPDPARYRLTGAVPADLVLFS